MTTITAIAPTVLKKLPVQSEKLAGDKKLNVSAGLTLKLSNYSPVEGGHTLITLANDGGKWYIFDDHWTRPWAKPPGRRSPITPSDVNWYDFDAPVSEFFTVGEVTKRDRERIPADPTIQANILKLANKLDKVREAWGSPIIVTSWYRPPHINRRVGGAGNSQHMTGKAADITPQNEQVYQLQKALDVGLWRNNALGYAAKKGYVHLDLREGHIRWTY